MISIADSLFYALRNVFHPRMLWLMVWPLVLALGLWGAVAIAFWAQLALKMAGWLQAGLAYAPYVGQWDLTVATLVIAKVLILLMIVPLVQLTALMILSIFGLPSMVAYAAARSFPNLEQRHGGSFAGSVWNSVVALAGMVVLGLASIPLWIFPPLWPLIPVAIIGWVNQRVLRYDALAEHADRTEMRRVVAEYRGALYLLGVILALAAFIPIVGFFVPVLLGLSFVHYLLSALKVLRETPA
ncbi:MAG TPA: EI24 domain-containing protein [Burkholderiales bacterium]|nr:EI24 domain-containing protein [Burkholderiales bacterium]